MVISKVMDRMLLYTFRNNTLKYSSTSAEYMNFSYYRGIRFGVFLTIPRTVVFDGKYI